MKMLDPVRVLFARSLGVIEPWAIRDVTLNEQERRLDITLDYPRGTKFPCPVCAAPDCGVYDTEEFTWRHLNHFEHATYIHARVPRVLCSDCIKREDGHGVKRVSVPWARSIKAGFTFAFEGYVLLLVREMPVLAASRIVHESDDRLWTIVHHYVDDARTRVDMSDVTKLAVDETASSKGHEYVTIIADSQNKRALFATPGKGADTLKSFRQDFVEHGGDPEKVKVVSCDMSQAYIAGATAMFPNAQLTFDKFHVSKLLGDAVDEVRRNEQKSHPELKKSRYLWLMNPKRLSAVQQEWLNTLTTQNRRTARAYQIRLTFGQLWEQTKEFAASFLKRWYFWATHSRLGPVIRAAKTIRKHQDGILSWFSTHVNNAIIESMNSLVQAAKRRAKGYRTTRNLVTIIYLILGKLDFQLPT
jgi:transposase